MLLNDCFEQGRFWRLHRFGGLAKSEVSQKGNYRFCKTLPEDERFMLASQLRRASRGIGAKLAEGHGRYTTKDQLHYCVESRGTLNEILNHFIDAFDEGYINKEQLLQWKEKIFHVRKVLNGYIAYLRKGLPPKPS